MSDERPRGERFRRLAQDGVATRPASAASKTTADLFEHFGVDEAPRGSAYADESGPRRPPEAVAARPCRRCTWLCTVIDDTALPCPNCGLAPLLAAPDDPDPPS